MLACVGSHADFSRYTERDGSLNSTTTQRHNMAAAGVTRVHDVYVATNGLMGKLMGTLVGAGSWSIPCTAPATFHKPRPRRPQVISS